MHKNELKLRSQFFFLALAQFSKQIKLILHEKTPNSIHKTEQLLENVRFELKLIFMPKV